MAKHRATRRSGPGASAGALGPLAAVAATVLVVALVIALAGRDEQSTVDAGTTLRSVTSAPPSELTQSASAAAGVAPQPSASPSKTSPPKAQPSKAQPSKAQPSKASPSKTPPGRPAASPRDPRALRLSVTGSATYLKVSVPGGRVLFEEIAGRGRTLSFDEPRLAVVVGSSGDVRATVNGTQRPQGRRGVIDRFTVVSR